jgi:Ca2+-transporting ATPase
MDADSVAASLGVHPDIGLSDADVAARLAEVGPNELTAVAPVPAWRRFAAQFANRLIIILLVAAAVALVVSREVKTPAVVLVVVIINATVGFIQERKAEAALDTLRNLMVPNARVRRNAMVTELESTGVVPGDIVLLTAGDRVPADGRVIVTHQLEVDESTLTGESQPVNKSATAPVTRAGTGDGDGPRVPLAERTTMVHANTIVTRGRAEMVVTATGMDTQVGHIAGLLTSATAGTTPLQRQLDGLARNLAWLSGGIVTVVAMIGLLRGGSVGDVLLTAVALAVATIPEGLPAVTALTLALGVSRMARRNAIIKRMASVETLGCTDVVCTDKTGTLTLNQMTVHELVVGGVTHTVDGQGYDPAGTIAPPPGPHVTEALVGLALCSDAVTEHHDNSTWTVVGDPTEGAVVVLAAKAGIDAVAVRADMPRLAEVPFDSTNKFMATAHRHRTGTGVVLYVKGAVDVLTDRAVAAVGAAGATESIDAARHWLEAANRDMGSSGMRVLALASATFTDQAWDATMATHPDPTELADGLVRDLTIEALVGIVDPPRPEARAAIAEAHSAGIKVRMITGDHAQTAAAIARQLGMGTPGANVAGEDIADENIAGDNLAGTTGIRGLEVVTGSELDAMDDHELDYRVGTIDVYARVSPEHKLRLVGSLQRTGQVVAMTGDGVNDAPALKQADIGVAMGVTGTEVAKEAATMVLADDNFATIVTAVGEGRGIYDNIVKFVRFQLSTTLGFAALFLLAAVLDIAGGRPFTAIAILWVNIIMDGPPALSLGLDPAAGDVMQRKPRPLAERILTPQRWVTIAVAAVVMAAGTLAVLALASSAEGSAQQATVATTMAFTTFVLFQFFNILNVRSDTASVFSAATLTNSRLWLSLAAVVSLQVCVVHVDWFQDLFDTTSINATEWMVCIAVASSVLWVEEIRKLLVSRFTAARQREPAARQLAHTTPPAPPAPPAGTAPG